MASYVDNEKNPKTYSCQHHAKNMLKALNESRKLLSLCDTIVLIGKNEIPAQKSVLSAASQYFRAYFNYEVKLECTNQRVYVDLSPLEIAVETFHEILNYIYTSEITLSTENIQDLFQASDLLLMSDLKNLCCEYLEHCITPQNCIGIREFTARFSSPWVHFKATQYLDKHFRDIYGGEEFLSLSAESVKEILTRDELCVKYEYELPIVQSILQWYRYNKLTRQSDLFTLLQSCVRANLLSDDCLKTLASENWGDDLNIVEYLRTMQTEGSSRERRGTVAVIAVCGGEGYVSRSEDAEVEVKPSFRCVKLYENTSVKVGKWIELASMITPRSSHGLVEVGGYLYAIGGRDNTCRLLNTGEKYNPKNNTWTTIAPMSHARVGFGLVAIDHNIYAIGGSNDMTDPMTSMEVYNTFSNEWKSLPDITVKKVWSTYAAVDKKIYVIAGGIIGKFYEAVECFDSRTQTWTSVSPMRERRCDARAVAVDDDIYVFGGFRRIECPSAMHSGHSLKFCGTEVYNTTNDYWVPISKRGAEPGMCIMHDKSHVEGTVYDGNEILAIGDLDIGTGSECIRGYNRYINEWRTIVQNQPPNQRCYQCCLLHIPYSTFSSVTKDQVSTPT